MTCHKCNGSVYLDRAESNDIVVEIACLRCGKRWELKTSQNRFAYWLVGLEKARERKANGASR